MKRDNLPLHQKRASFGASEISDVVNAMRDASVMLRSAAHIDGGDVQDHLYNCAAVLACEVVFLDEEEFRVYWDSDNDNSLYDVFRSKLRKAG